MILFIPSWNHLVNYQPRMSSSGGYKSLMVWISRQPKRQIH